MKLRLRLKEELLVIIRLANYDHEAQGGIVIVRLNEEVLVTARLKDKPIVIMRLNEEPITTVRLKKEPTVIIRLKEEGSRTS